MKKRTSIEEMNAICTMLISDFLKKFHYSNTRIIDIEDFVTRYLGTTILYEDFAVDVPGRGGFISDGEQALPVLRNGMRQFVIFPENVIVIDSSLNSMDNLAKYRFTVAHEAAHFIMCKHVGGDFTAAFHTEYVDGEYYTTEMLAVLKYPLRMSLKVPSLPDEVGKEGTCFIGISTIPNFQFSRAHQSIFENRKEISYEFHHI